jgi:hypothetical protein
MRWRVRLVLGLLAFIAVWWIGAALEQAHLRRVTAAVTAASEQRELARKAAREATLRLSEYQRRWAVRITKPEIRQELTRLGSEVNLHNAEAYGAAQRMMSVQTPWAYRRAWHRTSLIVLLAGIAWCIPPILRGRKAGKLRAAGRCVGCGYDLRATPERCPECGLEIEPVIEAA